MRSIDQEHKPNHTLTAILVTVIFLLVLAVLALLSSKQPKATEQVQAPQPVIGTNTEGLDDLSANYQACVQEGDNSYHDALNKIPEGTDSATRWNYIQSVQQVIDSHKANCDRIYQTEKDKLSAGGWQ